MCVTLLTRVDDDDDNDDEDEDDFDHVILSSPVEQPDCVFLPTR